MTSGPSLMTLFLITIFAYVSSQRYLTTSTNNALFYLHYHMKTGNVKGIKEILIEYPQVINNVLPDLPNLSKDKMTVLQRALTISNTICSFEDRLEIVKFLLEREASLMNQDIDGNTALHLAVLNPDNEDIETQSNLILDLVIEHVGDKTSLEQRTHLILLENNQGLTFLKICLNYDIIGRKKYLNF